MRNDRESYRFCTWHTMLNVLCLVYTRNFIDNYPTTFILSQKCQRLGCMSIKCWGRVVGSIINGAR